MLLRGANMKTRWGVCFLIAALMAVGILGNRPSEATQQDSELSSAEQARYVPNEVLVKFKAGTTEAAIIQSVDSVLGNIISYRGEDVSIRQWAEDRASCRSFLGDADLFHVKVPEIVGTDRAILELMSNATVEFVEKNWIYRVDAVPNDPYFSLQWGLHNTGQSGGTSDADIDAPEAWELFTGSSDIAIAIIDTGIDYAHVDLQSNVWANPGETGGGKETDGIDNDGNGYIDDWRGWDFVNSDNAPMDDYYPYYHGTHVAGIAGATGNNSLGMVGVCWNVKLMPLKAFNNLGYGRLNAEIAAIDYAISAGAQIINASWGGYSYSASLYQAIERAKTNGALFVASAGNDSYNTDTTPHYPSGYDMAIFMT